MCRNFLLSRSILMCLRVLFDVYDELWICIVCAILMNNMLILLYFLLASLDVSRSIARSRLDLIGFCVVFHRLMFFSFHRFRMMLGMLWKWQCCSLNKRELPSFLCPSRYPKLIRLFPHVLDFASLSTSSFPTCDSHVLVPSNYYT